MTRLFTFITSVLFIGVLILGYYLDLHYQQQRIMQAREQGKYWMREISKLQQFIQTATTQQNTLDAASNAYQNASKLLLSADQIPTVINNITQLGQSKNLQLTQIQLQKEQNYSFYMEQPIQMIIIGTYQQFVDFFTAISTQYKYIAWSDFNLTRQNPAVTTVNLNDHNQDRLVLNTTLHLYTRVN